MKQRNFYVPAESIIAFAELIERHGLQGAITGVTEDDELQITVDYEPENSESILEMIEYVEAIEELEADD